MKVSTEVLLKENLRQLKLSNVVGQLEMFIRQAKESGMDYGEFLLAVTEVELQMRMENLQSPYGLLPVPQSPGHCSKQDQGKNINKGWVTFG